MLKIHTKQDLKISVSNNDYTNKIYLGDSNHLMNILPDGCIDLVVSSPPYDDLRDYENGLIWDYEVFKKIAKNLYRIIKNGGVIAWVVGDKTENGNKSSTSFKQALYFQHIGFNLYDVIIYEKTGTAPPHPNRYFNAFEYIFILSKGKIGTVNLLKDKINKWGGFETYSEITRREKDGSLTVKEKKIVKEYGVRTNIWKYTNGRGFTTKDKIAHNHPAIFPEKLAEDNILSWSNEGDVVLDIFGGSGTTAKMSILNDRKWIYFEKVEKYCNIASERLNFVSSKENENV
jgi:site-specific DNA-methyltransferase (adenine-specific)